MKPIYTRISEFAVAAFLLAGTMFCIFPQEGFFFKWWEDHSFVFMLGQLAAGLLFFMFNRRRLMMVSFAACAMLCLVLEQRSQTLLRHSEKTDAPTITIGQFQLSDLQAQEEEQLQLILDTDADIISLPEVKMPFIKRLNDLFTCCGYPYFECLQDDKGETALVVYSRFPFNFLTEVNDPNAPGMLGRVEWNDAEKTEELFFFSTFLKKLGTEEQHAQLRKRLQNYAHRLNLIEAPLLACGNYNMATWSKDLYTFRTVAGLKESRRGLLPSLPYKHFSLLDFPFDHIFYSDHFKCVSFETISSANSSHVGIVGTYQFENQDSVIHVKATSQKFSLRN